MNYAKNKLNEQSQFKHSKNKSIIPNLPSIQNKYICNLLENNSMFQSNKTNKQDITSYCSKISNTFGDILSNDQKRTDSLHLIKTFRKVIYPKKEVNTIIKGSLEEEYSKNTMNNKSPFRSNLFKESTLLSHRKNEDHNDYDTEHNNNELKNKSSNFDRKSKRKHLTQHEIENYIENSKTNESNGQNAASNQMQEGGHYQLNQDNKNNKRIMNNNILFCFDSPAPLQREKEIRTKIIDCSPINIIQDDDENCDNNLKIYQQERINGMTIKGIKLRQCFSNMCIDNMKENTIMISNDKINKQGISNVDSFSISGKELLKPEGFQQITKEDNNKFTLIALNTTVIKENDMRRKPILRPGIFNKEIILKTREEIKKVQLIQNEYKRFLNKMRIKKENGNMTGFKISFIYKGNLYTHKIIDFNNGNINTINKELSEITLKGYHDDNCYLKIIYPDKEIEMQKEKNKFVLESKKGFSIDCNYFKADRTKNLLKDVIIESKESLTLFSLDNNRNSKDRFKDYLIESKEAITLSPLVIYHNGNREQSHSDKTEVSLNKPLDNQCIDSITREVSNVINSANNEQTKEAELASIQFETNSTNIDNNTIIENEASNSNSEISTDHRSEFPNKFKRLQTEYIHASKLNMDTLFPEDDKIKRYIDNKPLSKNKKKPAFVHFDENSSKAKEVEEIVNLMENEGKKKANQLRKKLKSAKLNPSKLLHSNEEQ